MSERYIPARAISVLLQMKQAMLADNALAIKVSGCGKIAVANYIDDLIAKATKLETLYHDYRESFNREYETVKEYLNLLGYTPDQLNDEEKAELRALVEKWRKKDEEADEE